MYILLIRSPCSLIRNELNSTSNTRKVNPKNIFFCFLKKYLTFKYSGVNLPTYVIRGTSIKEAEFISMDG